MGWPYSARIGQVVLLCLFMSQRQPSASRQMKTTSVQIGFSGPGGVSKPWTCLTNAQLAPSVISDIVEAMYPVGAQFNNIRRSIWLVSKCCMGHSSSNFIQILDNQEVGYRSV